MKIFGAQSIIRQTQTSSECYCYFETNIVQVICLLRGEKISPLLSADPSRYVLDFDPLQTKDNMPCATASDSTTRAMRRASRAPSSSRRTGGLSANTPEHRVCWRLTSAQGVSLTPARRTHLSSVTSRIHSCSESERRNALVGKFCRFRMTSFTSSVRAMRLPVTLVASTESLVVNFTNATLPTFSDVREGRIKQG